MKILFIILGFFFLGIGAVGVVLPVLPTTPFLLAAAFFFARGSRRFNAWFLSTKLYKLHLESFVQSRSMKLKSKVGLLSFASTMLIIAFILSHNIYVRILVVLVAIYKYYYFTTKIKTIRSAGPRKPSKMFNGRLIGLVEHAKKHIVLSVFFNWLSLLSNIAAIVSMVLLLDQAWKGELSGRSILVTAGVVAGAIVIRFGCNYKATMLSSQAAINAKKALRSQIYRKLLKLGSSYTEKASTAEMVQVAVEGVEQLESYFGRYLPQLFYSLLAPLTLFAVLSFVSFKAALILLICVPLIPISIMSVMKFAKKLFGKYWGNYVNLGNTFLENLQGLTTLKIYMADKAKNDEMNTAAESFRKITMKVLTMQLTSVSIMDLIAFGGAATGVIIAAQQFLAGTIGLGGALSIMLLSAEFFIPLRLLGSYFHIAMNGMAASDKIFRLLDWEEGEAKTREIDGIDIKLAGVQFAYEHERKILHEVSMDIPQGSYVAIVGESGSGKSTIAALLMGMSTGYGGSLTIGGHEVAAISEKSMMRHITWIGHNSYIFKGTVAENLQMGNSGASERQMLDALHKVKLAEFVIAQGGLAYELKEQGSNLSGGQRQRLALARALLHDSDIYVFDEATSNIDVESEESIMSVIHSLTGAKTVILISHRLANVVRCGTIYVLHDGRVAEFGNHQELLSRNGYYAELFNSQHRVEQYGRKRSTVYA